MIAVTTGLRGSLRGSLVIGMALGTGLFVGPDRAEGQDGPRLTELTPASVAPSQAVDLVLVGENFAPGAKVLIETTRSGRYVAYRATSVDADRIELSMPLGFPQLPAERRIFVRNPDGAQSAVRVLTIGAPAAGTAEMSETPETSDPVSVDLDDQEVDAASGPVVSSIWPQPLPAGQARTIEVIGARFDAGAEVLVSVNVHAGSQRLPEYALRAFPTELIDEQTLEVRFDRGFFHTPAVRELVVVNPDGDRSAPVLLRLSEPEMADSAVTDTTEE